LTTSAPSQPSASARRSCFKLCEIEHADAGQAFTRTVRRHPMNSLLCSLPQAAMASSRRRVVAGPSIPITRKTIAMADVAPVRRLTTVPSREGLHHASSSSSAFASFRIGVSKPSVNGVSKPRASVLLWSRQSRARLAVARSSKSFAHCRAQRRWPDDNSVRRRLDHRWYSANRLSTDATRSSSAEVAVISNTTEFHANYSLLAVV
jgi:antitoxin (DNA-binding transcriptional repressor) of toxin-antitoxin stability system